MIDLNVIQYFHSKKSYNSISDLTQRFRKKKKCDVPITNSELKRKNHHVEISFMLCIALVAGG